MSDFNWCHGPSCHTNKTQDRIRGVKGSKVLRTRKIAQSNSYIRNTVWSHFCSQGCWNDFMHKHWEEFIRLHPRTECLETPIEDPKKTTHTRESRWGNHSWTTTEIKVVDNA
jgi:hypothetical protein